MTHQSEEILQKLLAQLSHTILGVKGTFWVIVNSRALMKALARRWSILQLHNSWKCEWSPPLVFSNWKITVTDQLDPIRLLIQAVKITNTCCNMCAPNYCLIEAFHKMLQLDCDLSIPLNLATFVQKLQNIGISTWNFGTLIRNFRKHSWFGGGIPNSLHLGTWKVQDLRQRSRMWVKIQRLGAKARFWSRGLWYDPKANLKHRHSHWT